MDTNETITAVWPGKPYPRGATWDGEGVNFALFSRARREGRAVPVRRQRPARAPAHRAARAHRRRLALLPARGAPRPALRLSRARAVPARGGPPLQPAQAAARPYAQGPRSARCAGATRTSATRVGQQARRPVVRPARQRAGMPKCRVLEPAFTWGDDRRPRDPVARHGDLRAARARLHDARIPRCRAALRGTYAGLSCAPVDRAPEAAGRDHGRAAAGARASSTTATWSSGACATTGATTRSASSRPRCATARRAR